MPLPTLQTEDQSLGNTLKTIMQMRQGEAQQEHYALQNALLRQKTSPEAVKSENELKVMQMKKAEADAVKTDWENKQAGLKYYRETLNQVDPEKFGPGDYDNWQAHMKKIGVPIAVPELDIFFQKDENPKSPTHGKTVFDSKKFNAWKLNNISTADEVSRKGIDGHGLKPYTIYVPKVNAEGNKTGEYGTIVHFVKQAEGAFDPTALYGKGATVEKPATEKTFKVGDIRHYEAGDQKLYEEYDGTKWVKKSGAPRSPQTPEERKEREQERALGKIAQIDQAIYRLQTGSQFDAVLAALYPEAAAAKDTAAQQKAIDSLTRLKTFHLKKVGSEYAVPSAPPADTKTKAALTEQATALLQKKGYPTTQANIEYVIKQMQMGKK